MEIIRPQPKTYTTRRRKAPAQPKSYRVVAEEVDGQRFERAEFTFRWGPLVTGGILTLTLAMGLVMARKVWLSGRIADEACINQMMWVQPKDGWDTPEVDQDLLRLCYEREKMF